MSKTPDAPVAKLDFSSGRVERSCGRKVRSMNGVFPLVVSFDLGNLFEVVSDSPPEAEVFVLTREKSFEVSKLFCKEKVNQCQIAQSKLSITDEISDVVELSSCLFKNLSLGIFMVGIETESSNGSTDFSEDSDNGVNFSFIMAVLSKEFGLSRSVDDVFGNSN